jgi:crotonobetainyl-CoA:carnitine CoA-transferase CaiB-like acyl-CoA transferase
VIHVESVTRVDGIRMTGALTGTDGPWWERAPMYLCPNTNKRDLTIDLATPEGRDVLSRLIERSDGIVENFTPRVLPGFGFDWETIHRLNPRCVLVRMPAFGLSGPWSDNTGFAQTMEQVTGMAWLTGHAWDQPRIQRGPSDPNAGMHAAFSLIVGLFERDATGDGCHLETTMVEGALNAAAELVIEYTAHGVVLERDGNRSPNAAPQGIYPCRGFDTWLAISIADDDQWKALVVALGSPAWAADPALSSYVGRYAARDQLDERIAQWAADRDVDSAAALLVGAGVPAAEARDPRLVADHPQYRHRHFYERLDHPIIGPRLTPTVPFRFASVERWLRHPAPTLGQHNHDILVDELGLSEDTYGHYEARGIIGTRPKGL